MSNNSQPIFSVLSTGLFVFGELNSVKISVIHGVYFLLFYYHSNEIKKTYFLKIYWEKHSFFGGKNQN